MCTHSIPDAVIDTLDLSSWRTAFCGADRFQSTMDPFLLRFAVPGLSRAVFTCYGLAEMTVYARAVTDGELGKEERISGRPCALRRYAPAPAIESGTTAACGRGAGGEILLSDPSWDSDISGDEGTPKCSCPSA